MERIVTIDPGERTGYATGVIYDGGDGVPEPRLEVSEHGVATIKDFALKLHEVAEGYDAIVYETWRLYPKAAQYMIGNDMQSSQMVGMIRLCAWVYNVPVVSQGADIKETALKTMPDWMHRRMAKSSEQHDKDALMHLWFYYWDKYVTAEAK